MARVPHARRSARRRGDNLGGDDASSEKTVDNQPAGRLLQLPPKGFERLVRRVLRETGFVNVCATSKSGDDGVGA